MKVGFIGIGIMGHPMALNLINAGYELVVYNRTQEKCKALEEAGAVVADSPRDAAEQTEVIITIVADTPDVETVLFGKGGVSEADVSGKVIIDMSTISPIETEKFAERLKEKGAQMLDAPVSGGDVGAKNGTLAIMVGGSAEAFEKCRVLFEVMGKTIVHVGPSGHGQKTKMVNQILGATHVLAMAEGLRLMKHSGLDWEKALSVVSQGAAGSWMLNNLAPKILAGNFDPGFFIRLQSKDLRLAKELIDSLDMHLPAAELSERLFREAAQNGYGEYGTQGLYKYLEEKWKS